MALSLDAVYPRVAEWREAVAKGVAPSFSMFRRMMAEESPAPVLNDMYLLARAAPDSEIVSDADPALGNVRDTVEVEDAFSDTTVSPLGRVVTDAVPALAVSGEVDGSLW